ncbi:23S rRNA (adenine(2503)-C(2))-methyltransferase RlmN [Vineibacter terrae]|uniref:Dual-specificity RNA methyltransferase RlmN n=2 Tax=Vineibacter terrae TaxID=2586908 RepID=A0A5C8PUD1_9HYPH|nr:23S rRNA (adenine(2503)-C(2))-methyltransferase RlmN [Vineibacter terrae]
MFGRRPICPAMSALSAEPVSILEPLRRNDLRPNLIGLSRAELKALLAEHGLEPFRAGQIWHWVYWHGVRQFAAMSTIARATRERLEELFVIERPQIAVEQRSVDGTRKWLLRLADGNEVECVNIPEADRGSVCVSSQVGCTLTCSFCHTGTQPLVRNLTPAEIVGQFMVARDSYGEWPTPIETTRMLSNIVMMGMGEPLYNLDNVAKALRIVMDDQGIALSKRRITLSTSGIVPLIPRVGSELDVNLAVSLHAVTDDVRDVLVPVNKKWPIATLLEVCAAYPGAKNSRRITFEYVMLKGVNDSDADARELVRLLKPIHAKVNLIPFNPWPGAPYECSSNNRIHRFAEIVNAGGLSAPVRTPRGRDILAACGQLKSESTRDRRTRVRDVEARAGL